MTVFTRYGKMLTTLLLTLLLATVQGRAASKPGVEYYDSVEIGLITCSPHEEIYSLYGHTALRYHDLHTGEDLSFNYGVFNYKQRFFVLRFVLGKTDYELGIAPFKDFCKYYKHWGSEITEQVLNLTNEEKMRVTEAMAINWRPENRVYRYNFFYDNCATRPRDIIERCIDGMVVYAPGETPAPSFREMIHRHTSQHPWAAFGNDLLLGVRADMETTQREQHFLPENLERDFSKAQVYTAGKFHPIVKERRVIVPKGQQVVESDFPLTPTECGIVLLVVSLLLFAAEWRRKRTFVWWDVSLMITLGIVGIFIVTMFFSEHPATSTNLQVLLLNPLHLLFIPAVRHRRQTRYWSLIPWVVLAFLAGGLWQHYAEGMYILALCLLTRYWSHQKHDK